MRLPSYGALLRGQETRKTYRFLFFVFLVLCWPVMGVFQYVEAAAFKQFYSGSYEAAFGILDFEFAYTQANMLEILRVWKGSIWNGASLVDWMAFLTWFDFLFILLYVHWILMGIRWVQKIAEEANWLKDVTALRRVAVLVPLAGVFDIIENTGLLFALHGKTSDWIVATATWAATLKFFALTVAILSLFGWALALRVCRHGHVDDKDRYSLGVAFHRMMSVSAVLRPALILGFLAVLFPFTAIPWFAGHSIAGNLFWDYEFLGGLCFGFAATGTLLSIFLASCIMLDSERKQRSLSEVWVFDPGEQHRVLTLPVHGWVVFYFVLFLLLDFSVVLFYAKSVLAASGGLLVGLFFAYLFAELGVIATYQANLLIHRQYRPAQKDQLHRPFLKVFPWKLLLGRMFGSNPNNKSPEIHVLSTLSFFFLRIISYIAQLLALPREAFDTYVEANESQDGNAPVLKLLRKERMLSASAMLCSILLFCVFLFLFHPVVGYWSNNLNAIPPVAFVYLWFLPSAWVLMSAWYYLRRYRILLFLFIGLTVLLYAEGSSIKNESITGGPAHTYDTKVEHTTQRDPLKPIDVLETYAKQIKGRRTHFAPSKTKSKSKNKTKPLYTIYPESAAKPPLLVAAAQGGGILAAGWTTQVLQGLHHNKDLKKHMKDNFRWISANSGGAVGTAYYLHQRLQGCTNATKSSDTSNKSHDIVEQSTDSSLSVNTFGLFFTDFRRLIFPFYISDRTSRGVMLEQAWRANAAQKSCPTKPKDGTAKLWLDDMVGFIRGSKIPGFAFHTTVMGSGSLLALTPLEQLGYKVWSSAERSQEGLGIKRFDSIPTFNNYMRKGQRAFLSQLFKLKNRSRNKTKKTLRFTLDLWTAARLSATFSYVSPAAHARLLASIPDPKCKDPNQSCPKVQLPLPLTLYNKPSLEHLLDGGYHENYGVRSVVAWLRSVIHDAKLKQKLELKHRCLPSKKKAQKCTATRLPLHRFLPFSKIALVEIRSSKDTNNITQQHKKQKQSSKETQAKTSFSPWRIAAGPFAGSNITTKSSTFLPHSVWEAAFLGPIVGLYSARGRTQRRANDENLASLKLYLRDYNIKLQSFVFAYGVGRTDVVEPLSWHLSDAQKRAIRNEWTQPSFKDSKKKNPHQATVDQLKRFLQ